MVLNNEQQAYVDSTAIVYIAKGADAKWANDGALILHPRYSPGFITPDNKKFDFISARISSAPKVEFTYGRVEFTLLRYPG